MHYPNPSAPTAGTARDPRCRAFARCPRGRARWGRTALAGAALAGVLAGLSAHAAELRAGHPQDGPHVDLRVEIGARAVWLKLQLNLACADEFVAPAREDLEVLHALEWPALESGLGEFAAREIEVQIDGEPVVGRAARFEVYDADASLVALFPRFGARALTSVRFDLEYPAASAPREVRIAWRAYPPDLAVATPGSAPGPLTILARVAAAGTEKIVALTPESPEILWTEAGARAAEDVRFLAVPETPSAAPVQVSAVALACLAGAGIWSLVALAGARRTGRRASWMHAGVVGALCLASVLARGALPIELAPARPALPTDGEARAIFEPLHANIYRAFDYTDPSDVYDALAKSVAGALLERLYAEVYASLVQDEADGAVGRVQSVELLELSIDERALEAGAPAFAATARWRVAGAVFHWGHSHWRTQELRARYRARRGPAGWRIAASEILEQRVVSALPSVPPGAIPEEL